MHFQTPLDMQGWESPIRSRQFRGMEFATRHQSDQNHKLLPATKKSLVKFLWLESPCNGKQISQHLTLPARVIQWEQKILDLNRNLCFLLRGLVVIQYLVSNTFCPKLRILVKSIIMTFEKKSYIYMFAQKIQMLQKGVVYMLYYWLIWVPKKPKGWHACNKLLLQSSWFCLK